MIKVKREVVLYNVYRTTILSEAEGLDRKKQMLENYIAHNRMMLKTKPRDKSKYYANIEEARNEIQKIQKTILNNSSLNIHIARQELSRKIKEKMIGKSEYIELRYPPKHLFL